MEGVIELTHSDRAVIKRMSADMLKEKGLLKNTVFKKNKVSLFRSEWVPDDENLYKLPKDFVFYWVWIDRRYLYVESPVGEFARKISFLSSICDKISLKEHELKIFNYLIRG